MALSDLIFNLMGQQDPRQQLATALAGGNSAGRGSPGALASVVADGSSQPADGPNPAPTAQPAQSQLPQAYQSPPDLMKLYSALTDRQQANESINRGLGLLLAGFAHPENRAGMIAAMSGQTPDAGVDMGNILKLQQATQAIALRNQTLQSLPAIAKQLNLPLEQVQAAYASGALDDILKASYASGTPLNHAQVLKAVAEATEATRKTQAANDLLNSSATLAAQYGIPEPQVRSLIASGGWDNFALEHQKALDTNAALTSEEKQYRAVKADNDARGVPTPAFGDWLKTGGANSAKLFGQIYPRVVTDAVGKPGWQS